MHALNRPITHLLLVLALALMSLSATAAPTGEQAELMRMRLGILNQYFEIVESFHAIAKDPEKAAVLNLQQMEENYKRQNKPREVVAMYQRVLKDSNNPTLRNVAYMKLSEIFKRSGQFEKAVELLQRAYAENTKRLK